MERRQMPETISDARRAASRKIIFKENIMKLRIKETGEIKTLSLMSPRTACDYVFDFIGNTGAFYREFEHCDDGIADFTISQENYDWWHKVITNTAALDERIANLSALYGSLRVDEVVTNAISGYSDIEDYADIINDALDNAFGK